ncbi:hypothetical protein BDB01DRAFT_297253 [Pilobolus umbonatus]|nr:hypothetical protein BDB01DRAFT_297253 [Pilobolus umbonatus]
MSDTSDPIPEVADLSVSDTTTDEKSQVISGRRYNAEEDVDYMLPNDDPEADRLHKQHNAIKYSCGG